MATKLFRTIPALQRSVGTQVTTVNVKQLTRGVENMLDHNRNLKNVFEAMFEKVKRVGKELRITENLLQNFADELTSVDGILKVLNAKLEKDELIMARRKAQIMVMQEEIVELREQIEKTRKAQEIQQTTRNGTVNDRIMNFKNERDKIEKEIESTLAETELIHQHDAETLEHTENLQKRREKLSQEHKKVMLRLIQEYDGVKPLEPVIRNVKPKEVDQTILRKFVPSDAEYGTAKEMLQKHRNMKDNLIECIKEQRRERDKLNTQVAETSHILSQKNKDILEMKWVHLGYPPPSFTVTERPGVYPGVYHRNGDHLGKGDVYQKFLQKNSSKAQDTGISRENFYKLAEILMMNTEKVNCNKDYSL